MQPPYTLAQAKSLLPLVQAVVAELVERREIRRTTKRQIERLEAASSPEGLCLSLSELDAELATADAGLERAKHELERLGLVVMRTNPVTIHFPGISRNDRLVFCWQEGERSLCYGHAVGEEEDPRRPLRVKSTQPQEKQNE